MSAEIVHLLVGDYALTESRIVVEVMGRGSSAALRANTEKR